MVEVVENKIEETEVLEPSYKVRHQTIGQGEHLHVYAQRPLSFFGKMELFSLLGGVIEQGMKDGDISVADLLDRPELNTEELRSADSFIRVIAVIVELAPDFLKDLYCVALSVPKGEREYIKSLMEMPAEDGGLSDDDGVDILDTFVDQNWEAMFDFFNLKIVPLIQKISSKAQGIPSSKPSKATRRRTPKQ